MKRRLFTATLGLVLILAVAVPVFAIVNGQVDSGNEYPNVGAIVITKQPAGTQQGLKIPQALSSASLVHPRVVMTAAHSVVFLKSLIANQPDVSLSDFAVMFTPSVYEPGALQHGIAELRIHPGFTGQNANSFDIGLLILTSPVHGITPVQLPVEGFLEALDLDRGSTHTKPEFTLVGYGSTEVPQTTQQLPPGVRRIGLSTFKSLQKRYLMLSQKFALGEGGFSRGDSGGATFWTLGDGSLVQVGVTRNRTDDASVLAFIQDAIDDATQ